LLFSKFSFSTLFNLVDLNYFWYSGELSPPKPYKFVTKFLESSLTQDLLEIVQTVDLLLPQLSGFIDQFHKVVTDNNINVFTDAYGNMSIDIPSSMSDSDGHKISDRINVIDRVITSRGQEIDTLLNKGLNIEKNIYVTDPSFQSKILPKVHEFNRLNSSYKH